MSSAQRYPAALAQVETIRSLCMLGVFWFHLWSILPQPFVWVGDLVRWGNLSVVGFNVITGLVLAWPHLGPSARPQMAYKDFLRKRFLRICPPYYVCLLLWTVVALVLPSENRGGTLYWFSTHLFFLQTVSPSTVYGLVPAYWWLGLLAQFYLAFPLILRLYLRVGPARAALGLWAACFGFWFLLSRIAAAAPDSLAGMSNFLIYYNLPARLPEFATGMWLAHALGQGPRGELGTSFSASLPRSTPFLVFVAAISALGLVMGLFGGPAWEQLPLAHIQQLGVVLAIFFLLFFHPRAARWGKIKVVAEVARASYGIYLLHQPILAYGLSLVTPGLTPVAAYLFLFVIGGGVSYVASLGLDQVVARINAWMDGGKAPAKG